MVTFEKRLSKSGKVSWRVKIRIKGQVPVYRTFKTKTLAEKWANKVEVDSVFCD